MANFSGREGLRVRLLGMAAFAAVVLLSQESGAEATSTFGAEYTQLCNDRGVPIPPPLRYDSAWHGDPPWIYAGIQETTFAAQELKDDGAITEIFYWIPDGDSQTNPDGLCVAITRSEFPDGQTPADGPPNNIILFGVICQSLSAGHTCFWDGEDISPFANMKFGDRTDTDQEHFLGGIHHVDPCTDCHRGDNAFISFNSSFPSPSLFPGDVISAIPGINQQTTEMDPISAAGWAYINNDDRFEFESTGGCLGCHNSSIAGRFPTINNQMERYCQRLIGKLAPATMTAFDSATHVELQKACGILPPSEDNPPEQMMRMDGPAPQFWYPSAGEVSDDESIKTEGAASMVVGASGYVQLDSLSFATWHLPYVGSEVSLDVYVPPGQPNPYWLGFAQLFMNVPSAQINNVFVGHVELTPLGTGWSTITFSLPPAVQTAMVAQHADVRFSVVTNTPNNAPPLRLDNMQFAGTMMPAPETPNLMTVYDFENSTGWSGLEGAAVSAEPSYDQAHFGVTSLRVGLDGSGDGRVWTEPTEGPSAGDVVSFRVFIPTGTPVSAVQPYVSDANYSWHHSWNPNLPRDGWMTVTVAIPEGVPGPMRELGMKVYLSEPHVGAIFVDSVVW